MSRGPELRAVLPCTVDEVEKFCLQFRLWYGSACVSTDAFAAELLLREALGNGVTHGATPDGSLICVIRGGRKRLLIAVRDEGKGFNWRAFVGRACADTARESGRGLAIYYQYANRLRFTESGNGVTMVRFFAANSKD